MIKAILVDAGGTLFFVDGHNDSLLDFIRTHQKEYVFCIISDTELDLEETLRFFKIRDLFQLVLTSGITGLSKEKPEIYQLALEKLGVRPEEVLFIDDREEFIRVASSLGIQTIRYTTSEALFANIEEGLAKK